MWWSDDEDKACLAGLTVCEPCDRARVRIGLPVEALPEGR